MLGYQADSTCLWVPQVKSHKPNSHYIPRRVARRSKEHDMPTVVPVGPIHALLGGPPIIVAASISGSGIRTNYREGASTS